MQPSQQLSATQPLAIVGIGCRFPGGVCGPEDYWNLIYNAGNGIVDVPKERWSVAKFYDPDPELPGKVYVKSGGFLRQRIDQFDALFFGITPREASCMDPQQRLLLEVAWEAIENSGIDAHALAGANVGVYIGAFTLDNNVRQMSSVNRNLIGTHTAVGSTMTILSNRISYVFDLRGPSVSLDTACSSSLVAFHFACQDLWRGACSMALAGGVNVMFTPEYTIAMCKGHFLAPDGRCKSFDDRANGYGRGEGAGVVVLKPLKSAIADRDRIYAVVHATGCNQDGRTSGMTVPNPEAQSALLREVCAEAGVSPARITYVEAHGTGTPTGDPLEASALGAVIGAGRSNGNGCAIGSVKANIGHLEAASGIAGVIKTALCLNKRTIPPLAGIETPNRSIPFERLGLRLPTTPEEMHAGIAYAAVNSFGYGGTNACALLSTADGSSCTERAPVENIGSLELPHFLPLSARSEGALRSVAADYEGLLTEADGPALNDLCYSAGARRTHHSARLAVWADGRGEMSKELANYREGQPAANYLYRSALVDGGRPVFVFTGMGPQWWGMGQELYKTSSVFRDTVCCCDSVFQALSGWSILDELLRDEQHSRMRETQIAQPANFVIQVGLVALLRSFGIEPAAIVGHSVGEVSSAYVGGVLALNEAIRVSYHRSRLQKRAAGLGSMLAVGMPAEDAMELIAAHTGEPSGAPKVSLAAANSPSSVTLAGDTLALHNIAAELETRGIFHRFLQVEVPYHSHLMEDLRDELLASLEGLRVQSPVLPTYSTVSGDRIENTGFDAAYWWKNVRQPVHFVKAMRRLLADGHKVFLEVGPHPVLSTSIWECLAEARVDGATIATLRRGDPERDSITKAIGGLYTCGVEIDWRKLYPEHARFLPPPRYPWQRETYWHESAASLQDRIGEPAHPLLGDSMAGPQPSWQAVLQRGLVPYLDDHRVEGLCVLPGAAYVELGLAIQNALGDPTPCLLENLEFQQALVIDDGDEPAVRCTFDEKTREYAVYSQSRRSESNWRLHATGSLPHIKPAKRERIDIASLQRSFTTGKSPEAHYRDMGRRGLQYGNYFQGVRELFQNSATGEILARIEGDSALVADTKAYQLHPGLVDACFQALLAIVPTEDTYVPIHIDQVLFFERPSGAFWCYGKQQLDQNGTIEGHITLFDDTGEALAEIRGVTARKLTDKQSTALPCAPEWLYRFDWETKPFSNAQSAPSNWLVLLDEKGIGDAVLPLLAQPGVTSVVAVRRGSHFREDGPNQFRISPENDQDFAALIARIGGKRCERVAYFWGLDAPLSREDITGAGDVATASRLIQALVRDGGQSSLHLFVITQGAHPVGESEISLAQAPITGLLRVALNEYPEHRFTSLDLDPNATQLDAAAVVSELLAADPEDEIALRRPERHVHRLLRQPQALSDQPGTVEVERVPSSSPFRVQFEKQGGVSSARLHEMKRAEPEAGEIEVRVEALALSPCHLAARAGAAVIDIAGRVVRVGSGVETFKTGDAVVATVPNTMGNYAMLSPDTRCVAHRPPHLSQAASLTLWPFVFVAHALESTGLRPGQRVLVHAISEAGRAAVQIARRMGAEVFAAVHSAEEADAARACGAEHVISKCLADLPSELRKLTGNGVDVVFGLAGGEMLLKSFEALGAGGRYVHFQEDAVSAAPLRIPVASNRGFSVFDRSAPLPSSPTRFRTLWEHICSQPRTLMPAQRPSYSVAALSDALSALTEQTRESNVILTIDDGIEVERVPLAETGTLFRPDAWYLVTGGFGGLGLEISKWAVGQGARHLILASRRGATTLEAKQSVAAMKKGGAEIWEAAVDITDRKKIDALLEQLAKQALPLRGVMHTATVFDDCPLSDLNLQRIDSAMSAKALGALHLHESTRGIALDFFVLFSSISTQVGNPGQASYSAANAYLDAFAHWRRAQGLPATSINWGAVSDVGVLSRFEMVQAYLQRVGMRPFTPMECVQMLGRVLKSNPTQISIADIDWQKWAQFHPAWAASPRFKHLLAAAAEGSTPVRDEFRKSLIAMDDGSRLAAVCQVIKQSVAKTMQLGVHEIETERSLVSMGLDSLMSMELQVMIERDAGVKLSTLELMKGSTITQLSQGLLRRLLEDASEPQPKDSKMFAVAADRAAPNPMLDARAAIQGTGFTATETLERLHELSGEDLDSLLIMLSHGQTEPSGNLASPM